MISLSPYISRNENLVYKFFNVKHLVKKANITFIKMNLFQRAVF